MTDPTTTPSPSGRRAWLTGFAVLAILVVAGLLLARFGGDRRPTGPRERADDGVSYEDRMNCRFGPAPDDPLALPALTAIPLPAIPGGMSIWGATGRDDRGRIWAGISAVEWKEPKPKQPSAHLVAFDPATGAVTVHGDAVGQLRRLGLLGDGERQEKIHTRIVQAADRHLYFASSSEEGAEMSGTRGPTWGSHLWRVDPAAPDRWEHLAAVPEALIAVAGGGRHVFALGWFGHVLYHYDIDTGRLLAERVGSAAGHISRNFLADHNGHAYVPRLRFTTDTPSRLLIELVEYDADLRQVGATAIDNGQYLLNTPQDSHGITGLQYLSDRSIAFVTHPGYLFRVTPDNAKPATVVALGRMHPDAPHEVESLVGLDGRRYLAGVSHRVEEGRFEWLVYDLETGTSVARPLVDGVRNIPSDMPALAYDIPSSLQSLSIYGCITRDNEGIAYLAGRRGYDPVLVRADWADGRPPFPVLARRPAGGAPSRPEPAPEPVRTAADATGPTATAEPGVAATAPTAAAPTPDAAPAPTPTPAPERVARPTPREERLTFHRELHDLLTQHGQRAAPAIREWHRKQPRPAAVANRDALERVAARLDRAARVRYFRTNGLPESTILEDLAATESRMIGTRKGPRDQDEALVRAARSLLALPPP